MAGIIAAEGWNGKGGRGVAPKAEIFGINVIAEDVDGKLFPPDKFIENRNLFALGLKNENGELLFDATDNIAVFNRSYGVNPLRFLGYNDIAKFEDYEFRQGAITGYRSGRGALSVVSAGNEFDDTARQLDEFCKAGGAIKYSLTCYNANMEGDAAQNSVSSVSVASVNALGTHASYSSAGANLFISAPGGGKDPLIITTDTTGCAKGDSGSAEFEKLKNSFGKDESYFKKYYAFDYTDGDSSHPQNPQCNYTAEFTGTSAAAPVVSGVIALMVEANPNLTWRDIKHILAMTSDTVDSQNKSVKLDVGGQEFVAHYGWIKNAAGFSFNNLYGFGRVNAGKAVKAAKAYKNYKVGNIPKTDWVGKGSVVEQARLALSIPDNNIAGATQEIEIFENRTIEALQLRLDITNISNIWDETDEKFTASTAATDLAIEVISPSGTRSVVLSSKQAAIHPSLYDPKELMRNSVFLTNAFYGEESKGIWKIKIIDTSDKRFELVHTNEDDSNDEKTYVFENNTADSQLDGAAIKIYGDVK